MAGIPFGEQTFPQFFMGKMADQVTVTVPGMTRERVFQSAYTEEEHQTFPIADQFVTLFMPNMPVDQPSESGGGSYNTGIDSRVVATAFCRLEADIEGKSTREMEDQANGLYAFIQNICKALHNWNGPTGESGLQLFRRPMRLMPGIQIRRKSVGNSRWAVAEISFETSFVADLGLPYPV